MAALREHQRGLPANQERLNVLAATVGRTIAEKQSGQFTGTLTDEDQARLRQEATAAMVRMAEAMAAGTRMTEPAVQAEVDAQYRGICRMRTPNAAALKALGQTYVDDVQCRAAYGQVAAGLAVYQRDAMAAHTGTA
ncbi:TipAS antibiotic-recognition domain-containing protein [Streptomyces sp. NBC_00820]|uniref:TipAS antibiotic-recognition domain-containing protein n=1 Tax=Streptomyces sp. NBC_00820 TaxID=2975842 RepID=UPI002ED5D643|nr:TipAS antibiotic-recognition domain-containing protein [Streptomyces sp. NBC_00820]